MQLALELIDKYHPDKADELIHAGIGYIGSFHQMYGWLEILAKAVEDVGIENLDGQAIYNTAIGFSTTWEGFEEWGFSQTKRYSWNYTGIYEWSKEAEDLVMITDWLPLVLE